MRQYIYSGYQNVNYHPNKNRLDNTGSVIHSMCAATKKKWAECYDMLIDSCAGTGCMPRDKKAVHDMLRNCGFSLQNKKFPHGTICDIVSYCNENFHNGEKVIVKITGTSIYVPVVPVDLRNRTEYAVQFPIDVKRYKVSEIWITGTGRKSNRRTGKKTVESVKDSYKAESEYFYNHNENPNGNMVKDCAVRAVAGALEISWEEAARKLAQISGYTETTINERRNIVNLMKHENFEVYELPKRYRKNYTVSELCEYIPENLPQGTRMIVFLKIPHALTIYYKDGKYVAADTWDSTGYEIDFCMIKYPETAGEQYVYYGLKEGVSVVHKVFGEGRIKEADRSYAVIEFADGTEKRLSSRWVKDNCVIK